MEQQVLPERYIDKSKLQALLWQLFGAGNFKFEVSTISSRPRHHDRGTDIKYFLEQDLGEHFALTVPRQITEVINTSTKAIVEGITNVLIAERA
jgi:hypothetical protein